MLLCVLIFSLIQRIEGFRPCLDAPVAFSSGKIGGLLGAHYSTLPKHAEGSGTPQLDTMESFSLAGPYLLAISSGDTSETACRFYQLTDLENDGVGSSEHSEGAIAWSCLMNGHTFTNSRATEIEIVVKREEGTNHLIVHRNGPSSNAVQELSQVVSQILVQFAINRMVRADEVGSREWTVVWTDVPSKSVVQSAAVFRTFDESMTQALFQGIFDIVPGQTEVVEMVDRNGDILGQVPRNLVHRFNLLHRGIGLFVSKDRPLDFSSSTEGNNRPPALYVHQRVTTKRIFPGLYDMFVGGISQANEDPKETAEREVAEELGLTRASEQLSDCLGTCVVCTYYNRCVVDLFSYTMITDTEQISWQEEEVAWGAFVPYDVVQASANLSIQRLVDRNEWPGRYANRLRSSTPKEADHDRLALLFHQDEGNDIVKNWDQWDFVPDGLLVWEAWLCWLEEYQEAKKQCRSSASLAHQPCQEQKDQLDLP